MTPAASLLLYIPQDHLRKLVVKQLYICSAVSQLFVTLRTIVRQGPLSMAGRNTGVGYHALLQGTFLTHELNLGLLSCRQILYPLNHLGSPCKATVPQ